MQIQEDEIFRLGLQSCCMGYILPIIFILAVFIWIISLFVLLVYGQTHIIIYAFCLFVFIELLIKFIALWLNMKRINEYADYYYRRMANQNERYAASINSHDSEREHELAYLSSMQMVSLTKLIIHDVIVVIAMIVLTIIYHTYHIDPKIVQIAVFAALSWRKSMYFLSIATTACNLCCRCCNTPVYRFIHRMFRSAQQRNPSIMMTTLQNDVRNEMADILLNKATEEELNQELSLILDDEISGLQVSIRDVESQLFSDYTLPDDASLAFTIH